MKLDWFIRFIFLSAVIISAASGCCLLFACKVSKHVTKDKAEVSNSSSSETDRLTRLLEEERRLHLKKLSELTTLGIYFEPVPGPGDTVYMPGQVTIDKDGTIKAEGRLQKVLLSNERILKENELLKRKVDSLGKSTDKSKSQTVITRTIKTREVKKRIPGWLIVALILIGLISEDKFKILGHIKKFISQLKSKL